MNNNGFNFKFDSSRNRLKIKSLPKKKVARQMNFLTLNDRMANILPSEVKEDNLPSSKFNFHSGQKKFFFSKKQKDFSQSSYLLSKFNSDNKNSYSNFERKSKEAALNSGKMSDCISQNSKKLDYEPVQDSSCIEDIDSGTNLISKLKSHQIYTSRSKKYNFFPKGKNNLRILDHRRKSEKIENYGQKKSPFLKNVRLSKRMRSHSRGNQRNGVSPKINGKTLRLKRKRIPNNTVKEFKPLFIEKNQEEKFMKREKEEKFIKKFFREMSGVGETTFRISGLNNYLPTDRFQDMEIVGDVQKNFEVIEKVLKIPTGKLSLGRTDSSKFERKRKREKTGEEKILEINKILNRENFQEKNGIFKKKKNQKKERVLIAGFEKIRAKNRKTDDTDKNADYIPSDRESSRNNLFSKLNLKKKNNKLQFQNQTYEEKYIGLISAIFSKNISGVKSALKKFGTQEEKKKLNELDKNGLTPLTLTVKLSPIDKEGYFKILNVLLEEGLDPFKKDKEGWTAFEEAVSLVNVKASSVLFDYMSAYKMKKIFDHIQKVEKNLEGIPDCYIELKWEFDSSVIPLVSKFAPSDTLKIWKFGKRIRLDSTLAGYKRLKSKRRNLSLVYNPSNKVYSEVIDAIEENPFKIFSINRSKKLFYNPLEDVDLEEKKAIMFDIFNSMPIQGDFKVKKAEFISSKGFFGGSVKSKICGYPCKKFRINLELEYTLNKKDQKSFDATQAEYLETFRVKELEPQEGNNNLDTNPDSSIHRDDKINLKFNKNMYSFTTRKKQMKHQSINIHLTKKHHFSLKDIIPIIKILASGNSLMKKLEEVLNKDVIDDICNEGFPVKIQVPMSMSIRGNVVIKRFEKIKDKGVLESWFEIPEDFKFESRKVAQKILTRNKKRMILANMIL